MTFIKYTNDGKAVIQPAALTLSGLEQEETLEMHTLENAIVLLKPEMMPVEKAALMMTLMRLVNSLTADMMTTVDEPEANDGESDSDVIGVPIEAFADAGILQDDLQVFSMEGAVVIVSEDRKVKWDPEFVKMVTEREKAND